MGTPRPRGLTPNQHLVLKEIREGGGHATFEDVIERSRLSRARVVAAVRSLARQGRVVYRDHKLEVTR